MTAYSPSRLATYRDCPLRYRYRYHDRIKRDVQWVESFMGIRVHATLQKLYEDVRFGRLNGLPDSLAYYDRAWRENRTDSIVVTREGLAADDYRALGEKMIASYYGRYVPFDVDTTIGTEMNIRFSLDDEGKYRMSGIVDRLSRTAEDV